MDNNFVEKVEQNKVELIKNERIKSKTVRLVDDHQTIGTFSINEALSMARRQGLDLVLVADGEPPICRILDSDRWRYEKQKAEKEHAKRKRDLLVSVKEIRLRPVTDSNDISVKAKKAKDFLDSGDKIRVVVVFKGREKSHKEQGMQIMQKFLEEVGEHKVDKPLSDTGSDLVIILSSVVSKSDILKAKKTETIAKDNE